MNVGQLKKMLEQYPDDMEVIVDKWSDYVSIAADECRAIRAVRQGEWVMHSHMTMSDENKAKEKSYLYLAGN